MPTRTTPTQTAARKATSRTEAAGQLLTLTDVLAELAVPRSTFFRWKATGQAPKTIKYPNGSLRIRRADLETWLTQREEPPVS